MINWDIIGPIAVIGFLLILCFFCILRKKYKKNKKDLYAEKENYSKILSQKKSSEIRLGKIGENMAPFFDSWPYDPNKFRFIGDPIDGIQFTEDAVIFIEIKTGHARLTASQKKVKTLIKEGSVKFATFRVGETGSQLKVEDDED